MTVADNVYVTWVQREAAREIIARDAARGRVTRPNVIRIANAQIDDTGRYVVVPTDQAS